MHCWGGVTPAFKPHPLKPHPLPRFLRHVPVVYVDYPGAASLTQIYGTFNRAMLRLVPNLRAYAEPLTNAMVDFYTRSQVRREGGRDIFDGGFFILFHVAGIFRYFCDQYEIELLRILLVHENIVCTCIACTCTCTCANQVAIFKVPKR